ncbi:DUF4177 domain-containing protein [Bacillus sp. MCCB 382]|uniref:DUF4177 domain-containing protein n=1 Tax=Bacillus sp. MCCB 382 TaxID=2860197 RepID=UPI001C585E35|nr:DUF4177 domain-containing protein [Bacillus sp. MCCB 382]
MYEYAYVQTSLGGFFTEPKHREIIEEYAADGWRLPLKYNGHGKPTDYEIIFERAML